MIILSDQLLELAGWGMICGFTNLSIHHQVFLDWEEGAPEILTPLQHSV